MDLPEGLILAVAYDHHAPLESENRYWDKKGFISCFLAGSDK